MMPYLTGKYGNPGSLHAMGRDAASAVDNARQQVASFLGAKDPEQIIFTCGGTEGNNMVFNGVAGYLDAKGFDAILTSSIEHDSVLNAARKIELDSLCHQRFALPHIVHLYHAEPDSSGIVTVKAVCDCMEQIKSDDPWRKLGLVSVMSANNELGTYNPIYEICKTVHDAGALFHTDAVQAAGMHSINAYLNDYDFVTVSSHKIHGPKGVGALYIKDREQTMFDPLIRGGKHQEFGLRGGTENVAGIVGFGKACALSTGDYEERAATRRQLNDRFLQTLIRRFEGLEKFAVNGNPPLDFKTISLRFDEVDAQTLLLMLDSIGIAVSAGSACTAHEDTPSHVLLAIGLTPEQARSTIRVSFSEKNTMEEVETAAAAIADCVSALRGGLSPS